MQSPFWQSGSPAKFRGRSLSTSPVILRATVCGLGFRVESLGFRVQGSGFRVQGLWFMVQGSEFRVQGLEFGI